MKQIEQMTFEEALAELKSIFEKIDSADLPLEDAVKAYERSMLLKKHCEAKLQNAQLRVDKVLNNDPNNLEALDHDDTSADS